MPFDPVIARQGRIAISALFLVNGTILGSWAPQIPLHLSRHGITESVLGFLILGMGIAAMAVMCLSGRLTARHGSRAMMRITAVCCALAKAGLAPKVVTLAIAMAVMGASVAMMDVAANANAYELEQATGQAILSSTHGF